MSKPALNLTRYAFWRPHIGKGIDAIGTWYHDGKTTRPALVLLPTNRQVNYRRVQPCVITVDQTHLWAEETGDGSYVARMCHQFAEALGKDRNPMALAQIASVVHDEIGELLHMPPVPPGEIQVVADGFATDQDGRTKHYEIIDRV